MLLSYVVFFAFCPLWTIQGVILKPARVKRLSVLSVIYRKGNIDRSYFPENRTATTTPTSPRTTDTTAAASMTPAPRARFNPEATSPIPSVSPTDLTTAIAKLRSTRRNPYNTRHPVLSWAAAEPVEPGLIDGHREPLTINNVVETRKMTTLSRGKIPQELYPFLPVPDTTFPIDVNAEQAFTRGDSTDVPITRLANTPSATTKQPRETSTAVLPVLPTKMRQEIIHPSYHERGRQTSPPALHARLNINTPDRRRTTTPRREVPSPSTSSSTLLITRFPSTPSPTPTASTGSSQVTGSPANLSCKGKIGYFTDLSPECDTFLYCDQFGRSFRFKCPLGTRFNSRLCVCDMHSNTCSNSPASLYGDPCPPLV